MYGEGSGYDCRKHVQRLNLLRRNMDDQVFVGSDEELELQTDRVTSDDVDKCQNQVIQLWHF